MQGLFCEIFNKSDEKSLNSIANIFRLIHDHIEQVHDLNSFRKSQVISVRVKKNFIFSLTTAQMGSIIQAKGKSLKAKVKKMI